MLNTKTCILNDFECTVECPTPHMIKHIILASQQNFQGKFKELVCSFGVWFSDSQSPF